MRRATQAAVAEHPILAQHSAGHRPLPRTLANATILQIVPSLRDEPAARIAVETACGLL